MRADISASVERHPRGTTNRRLNIAFIKANRLTGQPVNVRRVEMRVSATAKIIKAKLVKHDEDDVLRLLLGLLRLLGRLLGHFWVRLFNVRNVWVRVLAQRATCQHESIKPLRWFHFDRPALPIRQVKGTHTAINDDVNAVDPTGFGANQKTDGSGNLFRGSGAANALQVRGHSRPKRL